MCKNPSRKNCPRSTKSGASSCSIGTTFTASAQYPTAKSVSHASLVRNGSKFSDKNSPAVDATFSSFFTKFSFAIVSVQALFCSAFWYKFSEISTISASDFLRKFFNTESASIPPMFSEIFAASVWPWLARRIAVAFPDEVKADFIVSNFSLKIFFICSVSWNLAVLSAFSKIFIASAVFRSKNFADAEKYP